MNLFKVYQKRLVAGHFTNDWFATVEPTAGSTYQAALFHHLTGAENGGQHNVFVDVLDGNGHPIRSPSLFITGTWEGRKDSEPPPVARLDKPMNEPGGNIAVFPGMVASIWLEENGHVVSDVMYGLRTDLPDNEPGNYPHHQSFYIIFRPSTGAVIPTIPHLTLEERVARIEAKLGL